MIRVTDRELPNVVAFGLLCAGADPAATITIAMAAAAIRLRETKCTAHSKEVGGAKTAFFAATIPRIRCQSWVKNPMAGLGEGWNFYTYAMGW